jgi:hypothetical protein
MKKNLICALFLAGFIIPQVTFASWWNPFTWSIFNKKAEVKIEQTVIISTSTQATISRKIIIIKKPITQKVISENILPIATTSSNHAIVPVQINNNFNSSGNQTSTLPPATTSQINEIRFLCASLTYLGQVDQDCNNGALLNGYNNNVTFRNNIDNLALQMKQKFQQSILQWQAYKTQIMNESITGNGQLFDPTVGSNSQVQNQQNLQNSFQSLIDNANTKIDQLQGLLQILDGYISNTLSPQIQQLINSIKNNTSAVQQLNQTLQQ